MRRLLYLATLSMVVMLVFAPTAIAQNTTDQCPVGTNLTEAGTCVPQDDRCPPGQVFYEGAGTASGSCVPGDLIPGTASPAAPTASAEQYAPATTALPVTGGPALLLPASVLLLGAGLIGMRLVRRS